MTERIRAGDLTRLITVQQRSTIADSFGQQLTSWTDVKQIYAAIQPLSGRELFQAQAIQSEITHSITVRYDDIFLDPKIVATYRLNYKNRLFDITAANNFDEGDRVMTLLASEGLSDG